MIRLSSPRTLCKLFVAFAFLLSAEGVSYARTTTQPLREQTEVTTPKAGGPADVRSGDAAAVAHPTIGDEFARIHICHISRHPRDGMPAEEHACPLVIADAADVISSVQRTVAAN